MKLIAAAVYDPRVVIAVGLTLTYIWRFHDFLPALRPLRLAAVFSVSSWLCLAVTPNLAALKQGLARPYAKAFLAWFVWIVIGVPFALQPENTWNFIVTTESKNLLFFLFLIGSCSTLLQIKSVVYAQIVGVCVIAVFYVKGGMPRWGSPIRMYDVNDMAFLMNMTLPFVLWAAVAASQWWERAGLWLGALLVVLSITGTQSRGGLLALVGVVGLTLFRSQTVSKTVKLRLVALVGVLLAAAPLSYWDRMGTMLELEQDYNLTSEVGRIAIWKRGMGYAVSEPLFGLGANNFRIAERISLPDTNRAFVAHNSFVESLAETGFLGFVLWLSILMFAFLRLNQIRGQLARVGSPTSESVLKLVDAVFASLVAFALGGFFLSQAYTPYLLLLLALVVGLERQAELALGAGGVRRRVPPAARRRSGPWTIARGLR